MVPASRGPETRPSARLGCAAGPAWFPRRHGRWGTPSGLLAGQLKFPGKEPRQNPLQVGRPNRLLNPPDRVLRIRVSARGRRWSGGIGLRQDLHGFDHGPRLIPRVGHNLHTDRVALDLIFPSEPHVDHLACPGGHPGDLLATGILRIVPGGEPSPRRPCWATSRPNRLFWPRAAPSLRPSCRYEPACAQDDGSLWPASGTGGPSPTVI